MVTFAWYIFRTLQVIRVKVKAMYVCRWCGRNYRYSPDDCGNCCSARCWHEYYKTDMALEERKEALIKYWKEHQKQEQQKSESGEGLGYGYWILMILFLGVITWATFTILGWLGVIILVTIVALFIVWIWNC